jgi:hypothetical protein
LKEKRRKVSEFSCEEWVGASLGRKKRVVSKAVVEIVDNTILLPSLRAQMIHEEAAHAAAAVRPRRRMAEAATTWYHCVCFVSEKK